MNSNIRLDEIVKLVEATALKYDALATVAGDGNQRDYFKGCSSICRSLQAKLLAGDVRKEDVGSYRHMLVDTFPLDEPFISDFSAYLGTLR